MWAKFLSTVGGYMGNHYANTQAEQSAHRSREENFMYGEMAANAADERYRKQYLDFYSPKAQLRQLKEAGLSPSVMYNGTGAGGATAPQGGGAGGIQAPYYPTTAIEMAQMENIMAQTNKTKAETSNVEADTKNKGQQYVLLGAQINNTLKDTEYKEVGIKALELSNDLQALTLQIENWKLAEGITYEIIESEARKLYNESLLSEEQWKLAENNRKLAEETFETNVKMISQSYANLIQDFYLKSAQTQLTSIQAEKLINDMLVDWFDAGIKAASEKAKVVNMKNQLMLEYKKLGINTTIAQNEQNVKILTSILQSLTNILGASMLMKGGVTLNAKQPTQPTQPTQPSLPYN